MGPKDKCQVVVEHFVWRGGKGEMGPNQLPTFGNNLWLSSIILYETTNTGVDEVPTLVFPNDVTVYNLDFVAYRMCDFDWFCLQVLISILNWSWRVIPNIPFSIKYSRSQYITNIPSMSIWTKDYTFLFEFLKTRHNGRWPEPHGRKIDPSVRGRHFLVPNWVWQIEGVVPDKRLDVGIFRRGKKRIQLG